MFAGLERDGVVLVERRAGQGRAAKQFSDWSGLDWTGCGVELSRAWREERGEI